MLAGVIGNKNNKDSFNSREIGNDDLALFSSAVNSGGIENGNGGNVDNNIVSDDTDDDYDEDDNNIVLKAIKVDDGADYTSSSDYSSELEDRYTNKNKNKNKRSKNLSNKKKASSSNSKKISSLDLSSNFNYKKVDDGGDDEADQIYTRGRQERKNKIYNQSSSSSSLSNGYRIFPEMHDENNFIGEENDVVNSAEIFDPTYAGNYFDDWIMRETKEIYAYGIMTKLAFMEMILLFTCMVISILVATTVIDISSKIYLIVGSIVFGVLLIVHLANLIIYWSTNNNVNHVHINAISTSYLVNIVANILAWVSLGFWQRDYVDEWELDSKAYENDDEAFSRLLASHSMLIALFLFTFSLYFNTLWAHMHPEIVVNKDDNVIIRGQIKKNK